MYRILTVCSLDAGGESTAWKAAESSEALQVRNSAWTKFNL
jgi:hypothetical protein